MEQKNIVATIYIKDGKAVRTRSDFSNPRNAVDLALSYNDSGVDKIFLVDLSEDESEHLKNLTIIRNINRLIDVKTAGAGNIKRLDDVKLFLYAGCREVILNGGKSETLCLVKEAAERFGKDKILVSVDNVNFAFKTRSYIKDCVHELVLMTPELATAIENITSTPYILRQDQYDLDKITELLSSESIRGIYGIFIDEDDTDIMKLKSTLSDQGILMDNFEPKLHWSDLKTNSDGLVPVIAQDYQTGFVYMLAYMNEEAFNTTIRIGKMTYWSRSRKELWTKGLTSGHIQYVKSLTADCDYDTILAKISQVGGIACHTGAPSCFFNNIIQKEYVDRAPQKIFENTLKEIISERNTDSSVKEKFDIGMDSILSKIGEEAAEVIIAGKDSNKQEIIHEITDLIYNLMFLMSDNEITWDDITTELATR
ncbi:MAG: bifunctional phosphoribosyl-AMP cyclohydrolase/phosphoribosyl-ATP diphosphatase HisIE [Lachnospiraceae bacterium]|uniref:Phosphoribosyl-AMP cyclohydrolase n=1 Tax=Candidatus Weimeria bifida TaxID=2599074 RepID=A0A6N7J113_9FIRM|nr:bifunctional phosphoribosyl-AMP cyclohydrolase/phosphoribosyl-ATP diphosphatase HisIE [Candidatus Weimeria bifida]RRF96978.1 MAG: bifunctional phosphoribosyl-AMP cyclohydrolase/phosphoribosyl-ATP diphosphatase HisIE [Lachnospiraceae bacterium]